MQKKEGFKPRMKELGVMEDQSGEPIKPMEEKGQSPCMASLLTLC